MAFYLVVGGYNSPQLLICCQSFGVKRHSLYIYTVKMYQGLCQIFFWYRWVFYITKAFRSLADKTIGWTVLKKFNTLQSHVDVLSFLEVSGAISSKNGYLTSYRYSIWIHRITRFRKNFFFIKWEFQTLIIWYKLSTSMDKCNSYLRKKWVIFEESNNRISFFHQYNLGQNIWHKMNFC